MSYFEDISKYSGDLSAQRDNFQSLIGRTKERLSAENQAKFDDITQRFEMIGGAISAAGMSGHAFSKAFTGAGAKGTFEEQMDKLKAKTLENNPEFSDFLSDARSTADSFGDNFSTKMGDGGMNKNTIQMGEIGEIYEGEGEVSQTAQDAYNQARAQLLDPSLRPDAPDSSITARGNKLVGDGDRVKAADIYASDGRLAYPGPKQMMPRGNIGSSVANAGAKDVSRIGASLHPEVDGAGQLLHNKPTKGLTLNAPTQTATSADSSIGFHNIEELRSVNSSLRPTPGGVETGRVRPNFDPITGARAKPMPGGVPDLETKMNPGLLKDIDALPDLDDDFNPVVPKTDTTVPTPAVPAPAVPVAQADPDAILPARPDQTTANPEGTSTATSGRQGPGKLNLVDVDNDIDTAEGTTAEGYAKDAKLQQRETAGGPKFENVKPSVGEGDLNFANKGGLLGEGEDILQSAESAALGDSRVLSQSKNTIGAFVEGLGAEETGAKAATMAAEAGGMMEMASGAGEAIGAGILIAGVLHDVLQKPEAVATNLPNVGKIGFDPNAIGGSMVEGSSGIA